VLTGNSAACCGSRPRRSISGAKNFRVDNVAFVATTTAQVAANDGTGFTSTFTEDGAGGGDRFNAAITDPTARTWSAQIRLTNAQSLDLLSIAGALPAGITSSFGPIVAGQITLILSGTASRAAYQTAIQAGALLEHVAESDHHAAHHRGHGQRWPGDEPGGDRHGQCRRGQRCPGGGRRYDHHQHRQRQYRDPESALLANDSDVDSAVLDVTAVSGAAGVTGCRSPPTRGR
jgi:hypothetical protein